MGIITSQKINEYYGRFKSIGVTFSKEIIKVSGLVTNQVFMKCVGDFWPCVIHSSSFEGAKVVVSTKSGILQKLERANNVISLRFCFKVSEKGNPVAFFVNTKCTGHSPYGGSQDVNLFTLQFTQRPPDDLIAIIGRILDANFNSTKRREERIIITPDTMRKLNIASKESSVFIQGVPRHCILRDISFSGAKIIMMGIAKFLVEKDVTLKIDFNDPKESFLIKGKTIRSEVVEGRKELAALGTLFDESAVPMGYKIRVNEYISQVRADNRGGDNPEEAKKAALQTQQYKPASLQLSPAPQSAPAPQAVPAPAAAAPAPAAASKVMPDPEGDFDLDFPVSKK